MRPPQINAVSFVQDSKDSLPRLSYRISEAAQMLGVSQMSVRRMLGAGEMKAVRRFRSPLIPAAELVRFVGKAR